jgi:hypothetical protein
MTKLRFNIAMSLDGYIAGPDQSEENPIGRGTRGDASQVPRGEDVKPKGGNL